MQNGRLPPISDEPYESSPREVLITISSHSIEAPSTKDTVLLRLRTADRLHIRRIAIPIAVFVVAALLVTFLVAGRNQSASFSADLDSRMRLSSIRTMFLYISKSRIVVADWVRPTVRRALRHCISMETWSFLMTRKTQPARKYCAK
jgi:hypothetical protein